MRKLSRPKLLIVDDEPAMVQVLDLTLRRADVDVLTALGGEEGISKARDLQPDIIITDLMMPVVTGFDLIETVLKDRPETLILVLTAFSSSDSAIRALRLGAFDYLLKPVSPSAVREAVARAAQRIVEQTVERWRQSIAVTLNSDNNEDMPQKMIELFASALGANGGYLFHPNISALTTTAIQNNNTIPASPPSEWILKTFYSTPEQNFKITQISAENADWHIAAGPIPWGDRTSPVLALVHSDTNFFDDTDLEFLAQLAPITGLAMEKWLANQRLRASNRRLSTLQSLNALTYNVSLPLNRALRLAVEGVRQHMGYRLVMVLLHNPRLNGLLVRSAAGTLDRFLQRRGDSPSRQLMFPLRGDSPPVATFAARMPQSFPPTHIQQALEEIQASDVAEAIANFSLHEVWNVPLWLNDDLVGILMVGSTNILPPDELNLLTTISNQIALLIHNANIHLREQQRHREMEALYHAGLMITSSLSSSDVLNAMIGELIELTQIERCRISRWDGHAPHLTIERDLERNDDGWESHARRGGKLLLAAEPAIKSALETQRLARLTPETPSISAEDRRWMVTEGVAARLVLPLTIRGKSIGVIELMTANANAPLGGPVIRLAMGLAAQAAIALENARLHTMEVQRLEQEMELAHRIQVSLLPSAPPPLKHLSFAARSVSAKEVGGDFYRYFALPDGKFGVAIGDVSGKGVPAALFMAITTTALDSTVHQHRHPAKILTALNRNLHTQMKVNGMNTGLMIAIFEPDRRTVTIANAGMIAPMIRADDHSEWVNVAGLPIGAMADTNYGAETITLSHPSVLVLASDGLIEANNPRGEMFGFERWETAVSEISPATGTDAALESVWNAAATFMRETDPHDDMTLITIRTEET